MCQNEKRKKNKVLALLLGGRKEELNIHFYLKQLGVCYVHQQQVFPQKEYFLRLVTLLGQNVQGYCPKILLDIYLSKEIRSCCLRTQKIILLMRIFQIQKCNSQLKISHRSNI